MGIKDRFKKEKKSVTSKFPRRSDQTMEEAWENKDKRSGGGAGKNIFLEDVLEELGITEFKPFTQKPGTYYVEILPPSFDPNDPYFLELPVHQQVGMSNDQVICTKRYQFRNKQAPCYRCNIISQLYKVSEGETTNEIKALFPKDRVLYLVWDRTEEINNEAEPEYTIKYWLPPKDGVHAKIQNKVKNKITKKIIDVSDISPDGEGKTIYIDVEIKEAVDKKKRKMKFPQYEIELMDREDSIPEEIIELLDNVVTELQNKMSKTTNHPLEVLLHFPEEGEMEELMKTENFDSSINGNSIKDEKEENPLLEIDVSELYDELMGMKTTIKVKQWMKTNGVYDAIESSGLNLEELVESIVSYIEEMQESA